jgi:hypothetical protein
MMMMTTIKNDKNDLVMMVKTAMTTPTGILTTDNDHRLTPPYHQMGHGALFLPALFSLSAGVGYTLHLARLRKQRFHHVLFRKFSVDMTTPTTSPATSPTHRHAG